MPASVDRAIRLSLAIWASVLFAVLWVGVVANLAGGGRLADDAWQALNALPPLVGALAWLLGLPLAVALWAAQADLPTAVAIVIMIGLGAWTAVAWTGLARTLRRGR